jgi:hypothetical protein
MTLLSYGGRMVCLIFDFNNIVEFAWDEPMEWLHWYIV